MSPKNKPQKKVARKYKVDPKVFKTLNFHIEVPLFVCSCGKCVVDTPLNRAISALPSVNKKSGK